MKLSSMESIHVKVWVLTETAYFFFSLPMNRRYRATSIFYLYLLFCVMQVLPAYVRIAAPFMINDGTVACGFWWLICILLTAGKHLMCHHKSNDFFSTTNKSYFNWLPKQNGLMKWLIRVPIMQGVDLFSVWFRTLTKHKSTNLYFSLLWWIIHYHL